MLFIFNRTFESFLQYDGKPTVQKAVDYYANNARKSYYNVEDNEILGSGTLREHNIMQDVIIFAETRKMLRNFITYLWSMVLVSDGSLAYDAYSWSEKGSSICLRHLFTST